MDTSEEFVAEKRSLRPATDAQSSSPSPSLSSSRCDFGHPLLDEVSMPIQTASATQSPPFYQPTIPFQPSFPVGSPQPPLLRPTSPIQSWPSSSSDLHKPAAFQHPEITLKVEPEDPTNPLLLPPPSKHQPPKEKTEKEDGVSTASDFVRKLYNILGDDSLSDIICWGPGGDFFVIRDVNEFTVNILPRTFKHSNFASFVRQLNKYDFHKIRNTDDKFGENSWLFRHPDFHADRLEALENIKRKVPGSRKFGQSQAFEPISSSGATTPSAVGFLQAQADQMARQQDAMKAHIRDMENRHENVVAEMETLQRDLTQQDGLMQSVAQYLLDRGTGGAVS